MRPRALVLALALAVGALGFPSMTMSAGLAPAGAQEPTTTVTPGATITPGNEVAPGNGVTPTTGANTPQPTGHDLPPRSQRISDTLIWLFLILVLVASVLLALFPGQVRAVPRPTRSPTGPARTGE